MKTRWIIPIGAVDQLEVSVLYPELSTPEIRFSHDPGFSFHDLSIDEATDLRNAIDSALHAIAQEPKSEGA